MATLALVAEGHQDIRWMAGQITSMLDPATSPAFGVASGVPNDSPVPDFPIHGHDEYFRRDCKGRTIYWLSGRASAFDITPPGR